MSEKTVPFARSIKEEICTNEFDLEQKKYLLSGFVRNGGTFSLGKKMTLTLKTEIASAAKLLYSCLKEVYSLEPTIRYEKVTRFGRGMVYVVTASDEKMEDVLLDLEILQDGFYRIPPRLGLHVKNLPYLVMGCFLANGSVNNPSSSKTSYFAEMAFTDKNDALAIQHKLDTFKDEKTMSFKYIKRREKHVLYLKKSDQISVFLHFLHAFDAMFTFENARLVKDDMNNDNRVAICDSANLAKTLETAKKDVMAVERILEVYQLSFFDEKTQAVMKTRIEKKDFNYREIAEYVQANYHIQITKSGVVHIFRKLRDKASEMDKK